MEPDVRVLQAAFARLASARTKMVTRREFLQKSVLVTGGLAVGKLLVNPLAPVSVDAAQVDPNDPGLTSSEIKYASTDGTAIGGYITRPKGDFARPAVVVIHAWDGISDHTRDVARRLAKAGYVALAPDLLIAPGRNEFLCK